MASSKPVNSRSKVLKQSTLSFASTKRTASFNSIAKKPQTQAKTVPRKRASTASSSSSSSEDIDAREIVVSNSDEDVKSQSKSDESEISQRASPLSVPTKTAQSPAIRAQHKASQEKEHAPKVVRPELNVDDPRWKKQHVLAKRKMGGMKAIHGENQNKIHEILRVFDLSYEYGPCIGVTRLERWERAHALGLNPPLEIREILTTRQGTDNPDYSQCVFYDEV